ncbi:COX15/CtaA family protein [Halobaculum gomorrense]|uniref:Cytochrome c oxidase assembly protein subunit 15 n=1 Tax=Halobaculum gomorrense TaxID=43928 RepID=A0A1M5TLW9_9EURY|nr:COX15/CtaA family protein [Halobaculum gomorrense]SHH51669.1 cytochrome c oxidase assembly protein subunit 15 [Halobaculum gomorrense]
MPRGPEWLSFRRYAAFTTGMALTLISLGIYTAATGSGLACAQQWPLCDGGVLPQSIPSFVEWFHRLWAMITGFFILGGAVWAWLARDRLSRRARHAVTLATVLTPLQAVFGAITVTLNGAIPGGYSAPVHAAHFLTGFSIFALLSYTTLLAYEGQFSRDTLGRSRLAVGVGSVGLLLAWVFSRIDPVSSYAPVEQAAFFAVSLVAFAALVAATRWLGALGELVPRAATGAAAVLLFVGMVLGRDIILYTTGVRFVNWLAFALAVALTVGAAWTLRGVESDVAESAYGSTDD